MAKLLETYKKKRKFNKTPNQMQLLDKKFQQTYNIT